jgi:hypothetical protein
LGSSLADAENWLTRQGVKPQKMSSRTTLGAVSGLKDINAPHFVVCGEISHSNNSTLGACRMTITLEFDVQGKLRSREVSELCPTL